MRPALIALAAGAALAVLAAPAFAQPYQDRDYPDRGYQGQDQGDQGDQDQGGPDQGYQGQDSQDQGDQDQDQDSRIQDPRYQGHQGYQGDQGYQGNPGYKNPGDRYGDNQDGQTGADQSLTPVERRLAHVRMGIDRGVRMGDLTPDQAMRLRLEYRQIDSLDQRYTAEGMTAEKTADLNSRLDLLNSRVSYDVSMTRDNGQNDERYER
jgi:hypothetical protein